VADVLADIVSGKRLEVAKAKAKLSYADLESLAKSEKPPRGFGAALDRAVAAQGYGLIAEIKKASPSAGLIRADFDPPGLARAYLAGGAACLSVLTDGPHFQGSEDYFRSARAAVPLPAIRKDFMIDVWQIAESRAMGADCVLLILATLEDGEAAEFEAAAMGFGMDVLVEVHDEAEFERALKLKSRLIGVNNRNLKTMITDIAITETLAARMPKDRVLVAESGLKTPADLARLAKVGARRFLIGESLMRQADVAAATQAILAQPAA
jgi:indole-3-glycerol phosphate synthase